MGQLGSRCIYIYVYVCVCVHPNISLFWRWTHCSVFSSKCESGLFEYLTSNLQEIECKRCNFPTTFGGVL